MKATFTGFAALCAAALVGCTDADFHYSDGNAGQFADWQGRWVVINYWAEWCAPCRHEIPELNALAGDEPDRVVVVGVNYDGLTGDALVDVARKMGIEFKLVTADPRRQFGADRPSVLPTTLLIDPQGNLVETLVGPQTQLLLVESMGLTVEM
jgi:thiol-disulfide isomerase/thioredoxin